MAQGTPNPLYNATSEFYQQEINQRLRTTSEQRRQQMNARMDAPGGFREKVQKEGGPNDNK